MIEPFRIEVPEAQLQDLRDRLANTRWPEAETVEDWSQGIPLAYTKELAAYWADGYDWRSREAALNDFDQYHTEIDGLDLHFIHQRSPHEDPRMEPGILRQSTEIPGGHTPGPIEPSIQRWTSLCLEPEWRWRPEDLRG